jgi:hypothetical protein
MDLPDGIHRNIPEADYHALRYVNASSLKAGRTSMAHMRLAMAGGGGSSPAGPSLVPPTWPASNPNPVGDPNER